jgi:hypothetical protein
VEIFAAGELIKTWPRADRGRCTDDADYPPQKIAFFMRTPVWCRTRAEAIGEHVSELVTGLLASGALHHLRAAQGILGLVDRYGADRLDAACARALEVGDPTYRTVKGILAVVTIDADPSARPRPVASPISTAPSPSPIPSQGRWEREPRRATRGAAAHVEAARDGRLKCSRFY